MTYAIRNSIIIFVLMMFVLVFNTITKNNTQKQLDKITTEYQQKSNELNTLKRVNPDLEKEKEIMAQHNEMQLRALNRTKFILRDDNPTKAYDYFTSIATRYCPGLEFDFRVDASGKQMDVNYNAYTLSGNTSLHNLYQFLYHIDNQAPVLKLENILINEIIIDDLNSGKEMGQKKRVIDFTIRLHVYYEDRGKTYDELAIQNLSRKVVVGNPFRARITEPLDVLQQHFVNIEQAKIIAISAETITLKQNDGSIKILQKGDKVAYGSLHEINWDEEYAHFKLNKYGISEDVKLYIGKD